MLRTLAIPDVLNTSSNDLIKEFYVPLLTHSVKYDRGVGYFSSGWIRLAIAGMLAFATNGGRARWITSPILDKDDWEAIETGDEARHNALLKARLLEALGDLRSTLNPSELSLLAWMVADEIVTFKLALPRNKLAGGEFHDKFGVFTDAKGDQISFNGSYNDSIQGTLNYESIRTFASWRPELEEFVREDASRFEMLWGNLDPNVRVYDIPDASREQILELRTGQRQYPEPDRSTLGSTPTPARARQAYPAVPASVGLRDYQLEAVDSWFDHGCRGLLEMATGSGKTFTALAAAVRLFNQEKRLALIIAVPFTHLVDQWAKDAVNFGFHPIKAYQSSINWRDELHDQVAEFNAGHRQSLAVITTHATFIADVFVDDIEHLRGPSLLIGDEVHHLGAIRSRSRLPEQVPFRLALSATPDRWFDDVGTGALHEYFGETVYSFPLERAIGQCLTPYYYFPHIVELTADELESYQDLSVQIARVFGREDEDAAEVLKMLLIKRASILNNAANKLPLISELVDVQQPISLALFYCTPEQIDRLTQMLGLQKGLLVSQFTYNESVTRRQEILEEFAQGHLQALVAMHCLDEGVDVPNTRTAFILASSGNPREFIQRRGRILRQAEGKRSASIHDLIAIPPLSADANLDGPAGQAERSILRREFQRFREFADLALNKHQAIDVIWPVAKRCGLLDM